MRGGECRLLTCIAVPRHVVAQGCKELNATQILLGVEARSVIITCWQVNAGSWPGMQGVC